MKLKTLIKVLPKYTRNYGNRKVGDLKYVSIYQKDFKPVDLKDPSVLNRKVLEVTVTSYMHHQNYIVVLIGQPKEV